MLSRSEHGKHGRRSQRPTERKKAPVFKGTLFWPCKRKWPAPSPVNRSRHLAARRSWRQRNGHAGHSFDAAEKTPERRRPTKEQRKVEISRGKTRSKVSDCQEAPQKDRTRDETNISQPTPRWIDPRHRRVRASLLLIQSRRALRAKQSVPKPETSVSAATVVKQCFFFLVSAARIACDFFLRNRHDKFSFPPDTKP